MVTRQISRKVGREYERASEPQFVEETREEYIERIGGRRKRTQRDIDLIFGGW